MHQTTEVALLRRTKVIELTGLSSSQIDRLERAGKFPRRRRISERASAYLSTEIAEWIASRPLADEQRPDEGGDPRRRGVGKVRAAGA